MVVGGGVMATGSPLLLLRNMAIGHAHTGHAHHAQTRLEVPDAPMTGWHSIDHKDRGVWRWVGDYKLHILQTTNFQVFSGIGTAFYAQEQCKTHGAVLTGVQDGNERSQIASKWCRSKVGGAREKLSTKKLENMKFAIKWYKFYKFWGKEWWGRRLQTTVTQENYLRLENEVYLKSRRS